MLMQSFIQQASVPLERPAPPKPNRILALNRRMTNTMIENLDHPKGRRVYRALFRIRDSPRIGEGGHVEDSINYDPPLPGTFNYNGYLVPTDGKRVVKLTNYIRRRDNFNIVGKCLSMWKLDGRVDAKE
eukprot:Nitzschia sp. Nitz4//scaffold8_size234185//102940//103326//NITZ4_001258-RA/size234185-processed-gene-0.157-mRNA-1//-1//CDS//3329559809//6749//frame0